TRWVLAGGNIRPDMADTIAALQAQGGAYTLETISPAGEHLYQRHSAIRQVIPFDPALQGLIAVGAAASTRILSFTVT
ncbi:D-arabinitol 4-dehydrogenase, partial [Roseateles sp. GG27B]